MVVQKASGDHGFLSNLYKAEIEFEGRKFPTSEHAYQFGKFKAVPGSPSYEIDLQAREWAMQAPKAHLLAIVAHGLFSWDIALGWASIKVDRMHRVLQAKFTQHDDLKIKLLDTSDAVLIEASNTDSFWGVGKKGTGQNILGKLLMQVRNDLRNEPHQD